MKIGKLDRLIRIERATVTTNEFNEEDETWGELTTVWAAVRESTGFERFQAGQVQAVAHTQFMIRHSSTVADLNPKDRILYDGRTFNIHSVAETGRREGLVIIGMARADAV